MLNKTKKVFSREKNPADDGWIEIKDSLDELEYYGLIADCD